VISSGSTTSAAGAFAHRWEMNETNYKNLLEREKHITWT